MVCRENDGALNRFTWLECPLHIDFVARHALNTEKENDRRFYKYLSPKRGFLIPLWVERLIGKRIVFSLNTAWAKFYQVDRGETVDAEEEDF